MLKIAKRNREKEHAVQIKQEKSAVQVTGSPAALLACSSLHAKTWSDILQRLYRTLIPAFRTIDKCLDPPEGWCSSHDALKMPMSLLLQGWYMDVLQAMVQIKKIFAWAIPSQAALDTIKAFSPNGVVEIGAGSGYWASLLCQNGITVVAYDDWTWSLEITIKRDAGLQTSKIPLHFPVKFGRPSVLHKYAKQSLLLVMPPSDHDENENTMAHEALVTYAGDTVLLVGERITKDVQNSRRTTAGVKFCKQLEEEWESAQTVVLPEWPCVRCELQVWQRKARDTSVVLAHGSDFAGNAPHAMISSNHTDRACLVKFFIGEFIERMNEVSCGRRHGMPFYRNVQAKNLAKNLAKELAEQHLSL